jgi:GTP cyclohydrolase II
MRKIETNIKDSHKEESRGILDKIAKYQLQSGGSDSIDMESMNSYKQAIKKAGI